MPIPSRIIQTGKSEDLPLLERAMVNALRQLHPDWEYLFFDDAAVVRFVRSEFPKYLPIFESFQRPIQKYDFFRYLAVYRHGGFYLDLDVLLAHPMTPLQVHSCVFPFEELTISRFLRERYAMDWEIGNYAFGATAEHPFLGAAIENCVRARKDRTWVGPSLRGLPRLFRGEFEVLNTTGPGLLSRTLAESPSLAREVTILFPPDVLDANSWHQFGNLGIHLMHGSWRDRGGFLRRRLATLWESWTRDRLMPDSRARGPQRHIPSVPVA